MLGKLKGYDSQDNFYLIEWLRKVPYPNSLDKRVAVKWNSPYRTIWYHSPETLLKKFTSVSSSFDFQQAFLLMNSTLLSLLYTPSVQRAACSLKSASGTFELIKHNYSAAKWNWHGIVSTWQFRQGLNVINWETSPPISRQDLSCLSNWHSCG